jgi:hypothetical protein
MVDSRIISIISKRHVSRMLRNLTNDVGNLSTAGTIAKNELNTHADTSCAGASQLLEPDVSHRRDMRWQSVFGLLSATDTRNSGGTVFLHSVDGSDRQH